MKESQPKPQAQSTQPRKVREITSIDLFQGERIVMISHSGECYRLTITRNDKLILQK